MFRVEATYFANTDRRDTMSGMTNHPPVHEAVDERTIYRRRFPASMFLTQNLALFVLTPAAWELVRLLIGGEAGAWLERLSANHNETIVRDLSTAD
jgi:hypothetical protein